MISIKTYPSPAARLLHHGDGTCYYCTRYTTCAKDGIRYYDATLDEPCVRYKSCSTINDDLFCHAGMEGTGL